MGRDDVIKNVCPTYRTDALLRKINIDRYDDRLIIETNLVESYEHLMLFAEKHLWDKFYLEGDARISLRNAIFREILVNTLIHREFTSSYIAKFVIEQDKMTVSNANRAERSGLITPNDFEPNPKNPIIAAFFRNIGLADELGSGVKNIYKYTKRYSGSDPQLIEGDIFRIIVPLDDNYSFDMEIDKAQNKAQLKRNENNMEYDLTENEVLAYLSANPNATQIDIANAILKKKGMLKREGARKNGYWVVMSKE